ncbi:alpha/beta-hydrolase [Mycena floridula]|nr:alpha/beta-hydrolase [Mycena floridula]
MQTRHLRARAASSGCGKTSSWTFDSSDHSTQKLANGRTFLVHVPAAYKSETPHAVVLSFHGNGKDSAQQESSSQLSAAGRVINGAGIIAVYPQAALGPGTGDGPEASWIGAPYSPDVDDIGFVNSILDSLEANLCIDTSRIYASGKSNGGGFTNILACDPNMSARIAAFAPVSAALYSGTHPINGCNPGRPVPIINFHGTADKIIPFTGRKSSNPAYLTPDIDTYRKAWATRNGCSATAAANPTLTSPHGNTTVHQEWDCTPGGTVVGETVKGLGHVWPTTSTTTFDGSAEIIQFFAKFTR